MYRIIGQLIEGFGTRALAIGLALVVGAAAAEAIIETFQGLNDTLAAVLP